MPLASVSGNMLSGLADAAMNLDDPSMRAFFENYHPRDHVYDECLTPEGTIRPVWRTVLSRLAEIGRHELSHRSAAAQQQIARDGVTFNPHDLEGHVARPWTLDPVPLMLPEAEWTALSERLAQRGRLMERILADLFGPQRLIRDRIVPPDLLYGHPLYYPRYHGLRPPGQRYLTHYGVDLARSPDGRWWVTGDRTRAAFGLGYVLENRIITSRMLATTFQQAQIKRLAPFYVQLREQLRQAAPRTKDNPRIVLWTKGPQSRAYFEDSYLARYLGYTLAEGKDLAVRGGRVVLKTLGGPLPVEVLFRRLDDEATDPVELLRHSQGGVSSLLEALRGGGVAVANMPGSRLVESPIVQAFLPGICQYLLGEPLALPTVATWWLGQARERAYALEHFDQLSIVPAYRTTDEAPIRPGLMAEADRAAFRAKVEAAPHLFVAQEIVPRSTTPVLTDEGLRPWYLAVRAYLVSQEDTFEVMTGGLARVSNVANVLDFSMTAGERSQDVWIVSEKPVESVSLLAPSGQRLTPRRVGSELPSRVADDLFWLGRAVEQAEGTARLLRVVFESLLSETSETPVRRPLLRALVREEHLDADLAESIEREEWSASRFAAHLTSSVIDAERPRSLRSAIVAASRQTDKVRDRIALDMWRTISRLERQTADPARWTDYRSLSLIELLNVTVAELMSFTGLAAESMTRTLGWRFLDMGRRVERAVQTSNLVLAFFGTAEPEEPIAIETLLRITDSLMTYRNRYLATLQVPVTLDLLVTDESNPRSVLHQLTRITEHLAGMPQDDRQALLGPEQRLALAMHTKVKLADVFALADVDLAGMRPELTALLEDVAETLPTLSDEMTSRYFTLTGKRGQPIEHESFTHAPSTIRPPSV